MKKQYKALMLDLDGTTIPNDIDGVPSKKVIDAISQAGKHVHVGFITGRPYEYTKRINSYLALTGPSISSGGAQVIDVGSDKILWQKVLREKELLQIFKILDTYHYKTLVQKSGSSSVLELSKVDRPKEVITMSVMDIEPDRIDEVMVAFKEIPNISSNKIVGWTKGTFWVQISHVNATKQQGIFEVAKVLHIKPTEIIGVGDGYNDFPLLMACGLKIAMGNAVPELKKIADYVAPSVEDDGVAHVIEKYIL
jgi:HAD superfamily hydrolase (TIGR01484 family)